MCTQGFWGSGMLALAAITADSVCHPGLSDSKKKVTPGKPSISGIPSGSSERLLSSCPTARTQKRAFDQLH